MLLKRLVSGFSFAFLSACGCSKYASDFSCSFVENRADYEVWYWRHVERDNESDNAMVGHATGLQQCEDNARAYAAALRESFQERGYICVLMQDGVRMEKHRNLIGVN